MQQKGEWHTKKTNVKILNKNGSVLIQNFVTSTAVYNALA